MNGYRATFNNALYGTGLPLLGIIGVGAMVVGLITRNPSWVITGATTILVGVTAFYAKKAAEIADASKQQADQMSQQTQYLTRPHVYPLELIVCPAHPLPFDRVCLNLVNYGPGIALDVRVHLRLLSRPGVAGDGLGPHVLPPGQEFPPLTDTCLVVPLIDPATGQVHREPDQDPPEGGLPWRLGVFVEYESAVGAHRFATACCLSRRAGGGWEFRAVEELGPPPVFRFPNVEEYAAYLAESEDTLGRPGGGPLVRPWNQCGLPF